MRLTYEGLKNTEAWNNAGIILPAYDPEMLSVKTQDAPVWVHFGIGNIFRMFIGGIADSLISKGDLDRGITCVETFDYEVVDKIYRPHDNLALAVTLRADGSTEKRVMGSLGEAIAARPDDAKTASRLAEIFRSPSLQMASFTITEKGYALRSPDGAYLPYVAKDMQKGPGGACGAMGILTSLLYERYLGGCLPIALVSMDNVSHNGEKLRESVLETARCWTEAGLADEDFMRYVSDEDRVSFPWTMIDKITPRPGDSVYEMLRNDGVEDMDIVVTSKQTYIAPYVNAEAPGYLVVEDSFPGGRPPLENAGVYMTDRTTVNKSERMKVTVCLNPIHTGVCTFACLLGYEFFADAIKDPELHELATRLGYGEGLPVVENPGIISPEAFLDELMTERFPNKNLGDTNARIAVDISQMVGIRFGENIKAYVRDKGSASELVAIPLAIAGWIRYLMALDDEGRSFELSPDPLLDELRHMMAGVELGKPETLAGRLKGFLSNERIFGSDLYAAGVGDKIEGMAGEMLAGPGAVRSTLRKYLNK